jgi:hypothetical protein
LGVLKKQANHRVMNLSSLHLRVKRKKIPNRLRLNRVNRKINRGNRGNLIKGCLINNRE